MNDDGTKRASKLRHASTYSTTIQARQPSNALLTAALFVLYSNIESTDSASKTYHHQLQFDQDASAEPTTPRKLKRMYRQASCFSAT